MRKKLLENLIDVGLCLGALGVATGLAFGLDGLGLRPENLLLIFLLAILAVTIVTKKIYYPLACSVASVLIFNFFFTEPRLSFMIDDPNYYISLVIFFVVSAVIFTITSFTRKETQRRRGNERKLESLNNFSKELLQHSSINEVFQELQKELDRYFGDGRCFVQSIGNEIPFGRAEPLSPVLSKACLFATKENRSAGKGTLSFSNISYFVYPFSGENKAYGVVGIDLLKQKEMKNDEVSFISSLCQIASSTIDKDEVRAEKERVYLEVENEKFKTALLRSLSHDIKTPLTALQTGSGFLFESYATLDDASKRDIIGNISKETIRLSDFVDNLLALTRTTSATKSIPMKKELVDDLLADSSSGFKNRLGLHQLTIESPKEPLYVFCNGKLIIQVLRNLISNALAHTRNDASVKVSVGPKDDKVFFFVEDNGGGLSEEAKKDLFKDFSTFASEKKDRYQGNGLGLSICASIVKAHNGTIEGHNNENGGATFSFSLPLSGMRK